MEAPPLAIDLDDVSGVDALEPHGAQNSSMNTACSGAHGRSRASRGGHALGDAAFYACAVRWLVDGMNVIGTRPDAWWKDRHAAMVRLVDMLERWAASNGADVTVVFEQPPSPPIRSTVIVVAHAPRPRRDSADDEIMRLLVADGQPGAIRVVTSDLWLSDRVHAAGGERRARGPVSRADRRQLMAPTTRYTRSGDASIAYQVVGDGPLDCCS